MLLRLESGQLVSKRAFIVPGAGADASKYNNLIGALRKDNFVVIPLKVGWQDGSFSAYTKESFTQLKHYVPSSSDIMIGFSFGGNIALQIEFVGKKICCSTPDIYIADEKRQFV